MATIGELVREGRSRLAVAPFSPPPREAALLLGRVLGLSEAKVLARDERPVDPSDALRYQDWIERRAGGEPVAYLLGEREFYGRVFHVDPRVLIPRPETEHLIEQALASPLPPRPRILEVGAGSGCIAVTLACELPAARLIATDLSAGALAVAQGNAARLGAADRVALVRTDLFAGIAIEAIDLLVSNPPYVDRTEAAEMSPEVCNFEPHLALFPPGGGGLETISRLLASAAGLRPGVRVLLEIGRGQIEAVESSARAAGFDPLEAQPDYAGIPRVAVLVRH
ncbi:MAG: peptide chain release factor N(5)-glutamine methyltransferase [Acidobacteriota bacterium]